MKILQLISSSGNYGAEAVVINLAQALRAFGCDVRLGVFRNAHRPHTEIAQQAEQYRIPTTIFNCGGRVDWKTVRQLRRHLIEHEIDVLHTHGYKADIYGYWAARKLGVPIVATRHGSVVKSTAVRAYTLLDTMVLRRCDRVVAVCGEVGDLLRKAGIYERLTVIHNGVDCAPFAQANMLAHLRNKGTMVVAMVGRLSPEKNPGTLLQVVPALVRQFPDCHFLFVGEGPLRPALEQAVSNAALDLQVTFVGHCTRMPELYASVDVVILPSESEGMPMVVLEALAAAKAVVASRVGAIPEVIHDSETGLLMQPGDAVSLRAALVRLLVDPVLRARLGNNGQQLVAASFSCKSMAEQYMLVYGEATKFSGKAITNPHHASATSA